MSQENVEVVRSIVGAWNRGDYSVVSESTDPDIEIEAALGGTFDGTYRGIAEARNFLEDFWRNFEQSHTDVTEYIPVGDSVVFEAHLRGRGKGSGIEVEMRNWQVCTVRNGTVVAYRMFTTKREALEAAGLPEQAMSQENVEFVRNLYAMIDRGDAEAWDLLPRDFVIDLSRRLIDPVILRGPDEMRAFYRDLGEPWAGGAKLEVEELIDAGHQVLVLIRFGGRGKMSGAEVEAVVWNLWTFRDGEPVRWTYFGEDRAQAREAAGLSEQAVSQENVEIVRSLYEAFNREDWDAVLEPAAPDFVLDMSRSIGPQQRGMYKRDQLRSFLEGLGGTFEAFRIDADEFIEAGEQVVVPQTAQARGRDGIEAKARTALVYTFRDSAVTRLVMYQGRREALEAAGLSE